MAVKPPHPSEEHSSETIRQKREGKNNRKQCLHVTRRSIILQFAQAILPRRATNLSLLFKTSNCLATRRVTSPCTMPTSTSKDARFLADTNLPFCGTEIRQSFSLLTQKEKLYTYWVSKVEPSLAMFGTIQLNSHVRLRGLVSLSYRGNGVHTRRIYSNSYSSSSHPEMANSPTLTKSRRILAYLMRIGCLHLSIRRKSSLFCSTTNPSVSLNSCLACRRKASVRS